MASAADRPWRRRRWRFWLVLLGLLLAVRIALPIVLGPIAEERLSRVLGARVDVGDVSFAPIDAVLTLRNVTVHTADASGVVDETTPAIAADAVRVDVQWLPLMHRSFLVRELVLESARIDLERLTGSGASLERFLRVDPASELPPSWTFALDRIVLRDTQVRLRDFTAGEPAALEVGVRDAQVSTLRRRASAFGRAPNLRVDAVVEGGRIRIDGSSDLRDDGVVIDALVRVKDVPLDRLNPYLPDVGWTAVTGRLSGQLHYQRDPGRRDLLSGRLRGRRVAVQVPSLEGPALAIRRVEAEVDAIDLLQHRIAVDALTLHGARLAVRADLGAPLPLLDGVTLTPPAPPPGRRAAPRPAARVTPWSWTIGHVTTPFARLHVAGADGEIVLAASIAGESLGPGAYWSPLRAWVGRRGGVAIFDGTARMTRGLSIDGRLTATDVDAPAFARAFGMPLAEFAQTGRGSAELGIEFEPGAAKGPPVDVRGKVSVSDVWLEGPEADAFAIGARSIELSLAGIVPASGAGDAFRPAEVRFSDATVGAPYVLLTRTAEVGWLLPPFAVQDAAAAVLDLDAVPSPAPSATPAQADGAAEPAPAVPLTDVVLANLRSSGGRVLVVDRASIPQVVFDVAVIEAWAHDVHLPDASFGEFVLQGDARHFGLVQIAGTRGAGRREVELFAQSVPLAAAGPYLTEVGLPYSFTGGTGSVLARVTFAGERWSADTTLTLREPRFAGDQVALRQSLGMPLEAALAALRDPEGDVTLQLPLSSPAEGGPPLTDMVAGAVREAVARARRAPLPEAPLLIGFAPGRAELTPQAMRQLGAIAELLAARRDAVVELAGAVSTEDRRWLAEQAVANDIEQPGGFMGVLRAFGMRDQRTRILDALEERREGQPGRLGYDDEQVLADLVAEGPPIPDDRLAALTAARLTRVANALVDQSGVPPRRVVTLEPPWRESPAPPAVRARVGIDTRALQTRSEGEPW